MKALFYYVVNNENAKEFYNMGCNNGLLHDAKKACELKIEELKKINPLNNYKIVTSFGRI